MKKASLFLMACLIATSAAFANSGKPEPGSGVAILNNGSHLKVIYKASAENDVKIVIRSNDEKEVFAETLRGTDNFLRPYNLSQLPKGKYSVEITDRNGSQVKEFTITPQSATSLFHIVPVTGEENKYLLTIGKMPGTSVNILIQNQFGKVLYDESRSAEEEFGQIINLRKIKGAKITLSDSNGSKKTYSL